MIVVAAQLLLLAPALASALVAYPTQRGPQNASILLNARQRQSACLGRGNETDEKFLSQCTACRLFGTDVPRLYIKEGVDGLGSRFHEVIAGMAIASNLSMALGGVVFGKRTQSCSHGIDIMKAAESFFGIEDPSLMFTNDPPHISQTFPTLGALRRSIRKFGQPEPNENIFIAGPCLACELDGGLRSSWYTPRLISEIRKAFIWREPLAFKTGSTSIVIHVRRGDVDPTTPRGTTDNWYFQLIEQLTAPSPIGSINVPNPDIHVFSSLEGRWESSDFDGYRTRGATVHLDGDPLESWAHFASADVFVMAKSSFSHVPALLNGNCVIYQPYKHQPHQGWVISQEDDAMPLGMFATYSMQKCLERLRARQA
jgi:hypothetical protein